jgi:hypothetical protein
VPQKFPDASLEFLKQDPAPVTPAAEPAAGPVLPQPVVDDLMRLGGVDGVWVEQEGGTPVVVLHYTPAGAPSHLPRRVMGMPTRIVGGEPIRAL